MARLVLYLNVAELLQCLLISDVLVLPDLAICALDTLGLCLDQQSIPAMTCAEKFFVTVDISLLLLQLLPFHYLFGKILIDKSSGRMKSRPAFVGLFDRVTRESFHELSAGLVLVLCLETCRQLLTTQPRGISRNFISLKMPSVALFADAHT